MTKLNLENNEKSCRNNKVAFTLAEVLITLGIIGVVAAMTLPTLIANYQKRQTVVQLKKSIFCFKSSTSKINSRKWNKPCC